MSFFGGTCTGPIPCLVHTGSCEPGEALSSCPKNEVKVVPGRLIPSALPTIPWDSLTSSYRDVSPMQPSCPPISITLLPTGITFVRLPQPAHLMLSSTETGVFTFRPSPHHVAILLSAGLGISGQHRCFNLLVSDKILKQEVSPRSLLFIPFRQAKKWGFTTTNSMAPC